MNGIPLGWDDPSSRQEGGFGFVGGGQARRRHADRTLIADSSDAHILAIAGTGTGKTRSFAVPALLTWPGGLIAIDVKGELYRVTSRYRRALGPVAAIDPFREATDGSGAFNPLSQLDQNSPTFLDDVYSQASLFANDVPSWGKDGPFWDNWGVDVIAGLAAHVAACPEEKDRSFGKVYELLHSSDVVYDLAVLLDNAAKLPFTSATVGQFLALPDQTRGGVQSTFAQQTRLLASPSVRQSLASNSIDPSIIKSGNPFTIYVLWPPDKLSSHAALLRLILTGLTQLLMSRRHKPPTPTLMLIDEAAHVGRVPALASTTTLGRGFGIRLAWLFQSYGQLRSTYPAEHEAILENCATVLTYGRHGSMNMSRTLSELAFGDVSADALFKLGHDEMALRRAGEPTCIATKLDYLHDPMFRGRFDANPLHMPIRE